MEQCTWWPMSFYCIVHNSMAFKKIEINSFFYVGVFGKYRVETLRKCWDFSRYNASAVQYSWPTLNPTPYTLIYQRTKRRVSLNCIFHKVNYDGTHTGYGTVDISDTQHALVMCIYTVHTLQFIFTHTINALDHEDWLTVNTMPRNCLLGKLFEYILIGVCMCVCVCVCLVCVFVCMHVCVYEYTLFI